jgi:hypothetical protein
MRFKKLKSSVRIFSRTFVNSMKNSKPVPLHKEVSVAQALAMAESEATVIAPLIDPIRMEAVTAVAMATPRLLIHQEVQQ